MQGRPQVAEFEFVGTKFSTPVHSDRAVDKKTSKEVTGELRWKQTLALIAQKVLSTMGRNYVRPR